MKRVISLLLTGIMLFSTFPFSVMAEDGTAEDACTCEECEHEHILEESSAQEPAETEQCPVEEKPVDELLLPAEERLETEVSTASEPMADSVCAHLNADHVDERLEWEEVKDNGDGTHTGKVTRRESYRCPDCGEEWTIALTETSEMQTRQHAWENGICVVCGADEIINEPETNTEVTENEPEGIESETNISEETQAETESTADEAEQSLVDEEFVKTEQSEIPAENETGIETEENTASPADETDRVQDPFDVENPLPGIGNSCIHENAYVEWSYYYWTNCIDNGDGTHTGTKIREDDYYCPDCRNYWNINTPVGTSVEKHTWSEGRCDWCEAQNSCLHENAYVNWDWYCWEDCADNGNGTHTGTKIREDGYVCPDCEDSWSKVISLGLVAENHTWEDGKCELCKAQNPCLHENAYVNWDWYCLEDCTDNGDGTHIGTKVREDGYVCPDCGDSWSKVTSLGSVTESHTWEDGKCELCGAENTCIHTNAYVERTRFNWSNCIDNGDGTHTGTKVREDNFYCPDCRQYWETETPLGAATEKHTWNDGKCERCDAVNGCTHERVYRYSASFQWENCTDNGDGTHTGTKIRQVWCECLNCKDSWRERTVLGKMTEKHVWDLGVCEYCEAKNNPCIHKNAYIDWQYYEWQNGIDNGNGTHTGEKLQINVYRCPECGEEWKKEGERNTTTEKHTIWSWNGRCEVCGTKNACNHENAIIEYINQSTKNCVDNGDGTHMGVQIQAVSYMCPDCGMYWDTETDCGEVTEKHTWYENKCSKCGALNGCAHKKAYVRYYSFEWADCTDNGDGTHTGIKIQYAEHFCPDCGDEWKEPSELGRVTARHNLRQGMCEGCGAAYDCEHANAYIKYTDSIREDCTDNGDGTHTGIKVEYDKYLCPDCGTYWSAIRSNNAYTESHKWNDGRCEECGVNNTCVHEHSEYCGGGTSLINCKDNGNGTHTGTRIRYEDYKCTDCGENYEKETARETVTTAHVFWDDKCYYCGAENTCTHNKAKVDRTYYSYRGCSDQYDGTHIGVKVKCVQYKCAKCKEEWVQVSSLGVIKQKHEWSSGNCRWCDTENPNPPVIACSYDRIEMGAGKSISLNAMATPTGAKLTYTSSNKKIVTVDAKGKVTCRAAGTAIVTVKASFDGDDTEKQISVTVLKAPAKVMLNIAKISLCTAETLQLNADHDGETPQEFIWTTSNAKLATVSDTGLVTIIGTKGTVKITAKTYNGKSASCTITVTKAPTAETMKLSTTSMELGVGMEQKLTVTYTKGYGSSILWESSAPSVATVTPDGTVIAKGAGTATITAIAFGGMKKVCGVSVKPAPEADNLTVNASEIVLGVKETFNWRVSYDTAKYKTTLNYVTASNKVVTVNAEGKVTPLKVGTTDITVTTATGIQKVLTVTVKLAPSKVTLNRNKITMGAGDTLQLSATLNAGASGAIMWTTSKAGFATVDANGFVTVSSAATKGTVKITAKTYNGKTATCAITIVPKE